MFDNKGDYIKIGIALVAVLVLAGIIIASMMGDGGFSGWGGSAGTSQTDTAGNGSSNGSNGGSNGSGTGNGVNGTLATPGVSDGTAGNANFGEASNTISETALRSTAFTYLGVDHGDGIPAFVLRNSEGYDLSNGDIVYFEVLDYVKATHTFVYATQILTEKDENNKYKKMESLLIAHNYKTGAYQVIFDYSGAPHTDGQRSMFAQKLSYGSVQDYGYTPEPKDAGYFVYYGGNVYYYHWDSVKGNAFTAANNDGKKGAYRLYRYAGTQSAIASAYAAKSKEFYGSEGAAQSGNVNSVTVTGDKLDGLNGYKTIYFSFTLDSKSYDGDELANLSDADVESGNNSFDRKVQEGQRTFLMEFTLIPLSEQSMLDIRADVVANKGESVYDIECHKTTSFGYPSNVPGGNTLASACGEGGHSNWNNAVHWGTDGCNSWIDINGFGRYNRSHADVRWTDSCWLAGTDKRGYSLSTYKNTATSKIGNEITIAKDSIGGSILYKGDKPATDIKLGTELDNYYYYDGGTSDANKVFLSGCIKEVEPVFAQTRIGYYRQLEFKCHLYKAETDMGLWTEYHGNEGGDNLLADHGWKKYNVYGEQNSAESYLSYYKMKMSDGSCLIKYRTIDVETRERQESVDDEGNTTVKYSYPKGMAIVESGKAGKSAVFFTNDGDKGASYLKIDVNNVNNTNTILKNALVSASDGGSAGEPIYYAWEVPGKDNLIMVFGGTNIYFGVPDVETYVTENEVEVLVPNIGANGISYTVQTVPQYKETEMPGVLIPYDAVRGDYVYTDQDMSDVGSNSKSSVDISMNVGGMDIDFEMKGDMVPSSGLKTDMSTTSKDGKTLDESNNIETSYSSTQGDKQDASHYDERLKEYNNYKNDNVDMNSKSAEDKFKSAVNKDSVKQSIGSSFNFDKGVSQYEKDSDSGKVQPCNVIVKSVSYNGNKVDEAELLFTTPQYGVTYVKIEQINGEPQVRYSSKLIDKCYLQSWTISASDNEYIAVGFDVDNGTFTETDLPFAHVINYRLPTNPEATAKRGTIEKLVNKQAKEATDALGNEILEQARKTSEVADMADRMYVEYAKSIELVNMYKKYEEDSSKIGEVESKRDYILLSAVLLRDARLNMERVSSTTTQNLNKGMNQLNQFVDKLYNGTVKLYDDDENDLVAALKNNATGVQTKLEAAVKNTAADKNSELYKIINNTIATGAAASNAEIADWQNYAEAVRDLGDMGMEYIDNVLKAELIKNYVALNITGNSGTELYDCAKGEQYKAELLSDADTIGKVLSVQLADILGDAPVTSNIYTLIPDTYVNFKNAAHDVFIINDKIKNSVDTLTANELYHSENKAELQGIANQNIDDKIVYMMNKAVGVLGKETPKDLNNLMSAVNSQNNSDCKTYKLALISDFADTKTEESIESCISESYSNFAIAWHHQILANRYNALATQSEGEDEAQYEMAVNNAKVIEKNLEQYTSLVTGQLKEAERLIGNALKASAYKGYYSAYSV